MIIAIVCLLVLVCANHLTAYVFEVWNYQKVVAILMGLQILLCLAGLVLGFAWIMIETFGR